MFGTQVSQRFLIGLATLSALIMIVPGLLEARAASEAKSAEGGPKPSIFPIVWVGAAVAVAIFMARSVSPVPPVLVAYGRYAPTYYPPNALYVGEGMNSSIAVTELDNGVRNFHVSGKIEASTEPQDMRLQRMLGHISALAHPAPKSVLIVGFGAGVTAGTFVLHPGIERIVICEIEPLIPEIVAQYFGDENYNVLDDPRVEVIYDDARHYIRTTDETFDVITSDPIHPWVKGAASLYTQEYFDLARQHLNPGGVMTQWVPLYESEERVVKSEIGTFMNVFPQGTIWSNDINGEGYDVVVVGQNEPTVIDVDALQDRLLRPEYVDVAISLREVGFNSALDLLGTYAGRGTELAPWLVDAEINRDRNLRLMYIAGLGMNLYQQGSIYDAILQYRDWPEGLFVGEPARVETLRAMLGG
jgi:spermidine synthase